MIVAKYKKLLHSELVGKDDVIIKKHSISDLL